MSFFPETIAAHLGGRTVRASFLVLFDFATVPWRVWTGAGKLNTAGHDWFGTGIFGSVTGLEQAVNGEAPETTFSISGIPSRVLTLAKTEFGDEARNRLAKVYIQFHNEHNDQRRELFDQPFAIWAGRMQTPRFTMQGASKRKLEVTAESLNALRSRPAYSQYTDADQQARFPGDLGFQFVVGLVNKVVTWPDF